VSIYFSIEPQGKRSKVLAHAQWLNFGSSLNPNIAKNVVFVEKIIEKYIKQNLNHNKL